MYVVITAITPAGSVLALYGGEACMAEIIWRFPMQCPHCKADDGRPVRVESKTAAEVTVHLRCGICAHEWTEHRATPLLTPQMPARMPPKDQA